MKYYFVSNQNFDNTILNPRIPITAMETENKITNRICVSKSLLGCLYAILKSLKDKDIIYVHTCETTEVYQPSEKQVHDVFLTGEEWILNPVKMKLQTTYTLTIKELEDEDICSYNFYDKEHSDFIKLYNCIYKRHY